MSGKIPSSETFSAWPIGPDAASAESEEIPFRAIANFTYDWETWVGRDRQPRWVNPAVERITGYTPRQCLDMPDYPLPLVHDEDRATISACLASAARGESGNDIEFRIMHKCGEERWGAVSWQSITDRDGRRIGYRTSVRDITDRKRVEQRLRQAHETAARANLAKSKFLAAASHDLRQPIQAISMFVAALKLTSDENQRREIVESIQESIGATDDLLNALLDVSRLDAGVLQPRIRAFAVGDILERIEREFAAQAAEQELTFRTVISSQIVLGDPVLVERILRNLVSNALRYTPGGTVLVGCRHRADSLRVEVHDTGIGIALQDKEKIFEEFQQLHNPERDRAKGLGLGLSIVERLAGLLGYDVFVASEPGRGSTFGITVPKAADGLAREALPTLELAEGLLRDRHVAVIDDDTVQLKAIAALLQQWGCHVVTAETADEALAGIRLWNRRPDLLLADFRLRERRTGIDAITTVRRQYGPELPGVILTGDTEPARLAEVAQSGMHLLHKPIRPDDLYRKLVELI